ncbi:hypothetical protein KR52_07245 [Synechococcus sp. KORDI-52]|uniref:hypothetical protein n=1 Tax=Synechococcus sp. KORDI-52 TaxID=585425 RepID=UPI0004E03BEE|nr:hypothetical protein [Synechococcus sp. KORDI-52]AII48935.1 hypothetical protein KR52_07245 [Synechococcus sp. KORDI-52]
MAEFTTALEPLTASIGELVTEFLDRARSPVGELEAPSTRQAGLMYELDSMVSDFLDQHQLSSDEFMLLEQQVLKSIAEELTLEEADGGSLQLSPDDEGNFAADSVLAALDLSITDHALHDSVTSVDPVGLDG